jgi:probable HAF family extracellular repeat protein
MQEIRMKNLYSAAVIVAFLLAGCADGGPTAPIVRNAPAGLANVTSSEGVFSLVEITDEDDLFMGGGIEDPVVGLAAAEPTLLASTQSPHTSIDMPGASATRAFGINAVGEIVGSYTDATGTHGFLWVNGDFTMIKVPGAVSTEAWGINPQGDIVGRYRKVGDARTFGFLLSDGVFTNISVPGHIHTLPIKISPSRDIVGCFHDTNFLIDMRGYSQRGDRVKSFELLPSTMHNGVTPGGGVIAGISFESVTLVHGYVLDRGVYTQFDAPGATFTEAWDINPSGTVVGYFNPVTSHGFSRDANGLTVIDVSGALWTRIFGINPRGDMVGSYADASNRVHGFLLRGAAK